MSEKHHIPIMVDQFLSFFEDRNLKTFIDGTLGAAGHAKALLERHPEIESFYGIDRDLDALAIASETLKPFQSKVKLIHGNFLQMDQLVSHPSVDGIFLDLGVSSMQLDRPEKGFSFMKEGPLDMRMDGTAELSAADIVNTFPEKKLAEIFRDYGEEPRWKAAATAIVEARRKKKITTTSELTEVLKRVLTWSRRRGKVHPMTLVFQALRIYVNDELKGLQEALPKAINLLATEGRLGVISFHSLEDRIVKETFRSHKDAIKILTKKPLIADAAEVRQNPRSRSAKLRFAEKL